MHSLPYYHIPYRVVHLLQLMIPHWHIIITQVHSWSCTFYELWQMYNDTSHHYCIINIIVLYITPRSLTTVSHFQSSIWNSYNGAFADWQLSLHGLIFISFYFSIISYHLGSYSLFTHSPTEGYLGCFYILVIINKVYTTIHMQVFGWM